MGHCEKTYGKTLLLGVDQTFETSVVELKSKLEHWRSIRQPSSSGAQQYDRASLSILAWTWASATDHRIGTVYPFVGHLVPEMFRAQELLDNQELKDLARSVLAAIAGLPYPVALVRPVLSTLVNLLRTSASWRVRLDVLPVLQGDSDSSLSKSLRVD